VGKVREAAHRAEAAAGTPNRTEARAKIGVDVKGKVASSKMCIR